MLLHRTSAAELVADTLMKLIITGALPAGEPLREINLAKQLGISRNSLREGIRLLEQSRLLKHEMHRGTLVSEPTLRDLDDLYRTRQHIELTATQVAATDEQIQRIREAFSALQQVATSQQAPPIVAADLELHQAIVALLGSERISEFYRQICKELVFYFTVLSYADEEYVNPEEPIVARHQEIHEAICERRTDDATELMRAHITAAHERLRTILKTRGTERSSR